jgi:O-antigen/teichoic acid export membrane protein
MITFLLGLSATSVYQIAFYISSIIFVPSQAIARISMPIVAKQWKDKDLIGMKELYQKSSLNQLITGGIVFLMVWVNIDDLFKFLKPEYAEGKWAVLLLSLSVLFNMVTGINQVIIVITKYFRYDTYASIALAVLTIVTNLTFIPLFGLNGAAFATLLSIVMYHTFKNILIQVKLKMQPFTMNTLWAIVLIVSCYLITSLIPNITSNLIVMILIKCAVISILYLGTIYITGISLDIQSEISSYLKKIKNLLGIS